MHPAIAARIFAPVVAELLTCLNERMTTMQLYHCHKIVEASKITLVTSISGTGEDNKPYIIPHKAEVETADGIFNVSYGEKMPAIGDYLVRYADGYVSWSPAKAFEEGYTAIPSGQSGDAMYGLHAMKQGKKVARRGWNGVKAGLNMFVVLMPELHLPPYNTQEPGPKVNDRTAKHIGEDTPLDSQPYFALHTGVEGANWQPGWTPSVMDCLANDWYVVE